MKPSLFVYDPVQVRPRAWYLHSSTKIGVTTEFSFLFLPDPTRTPWRQHADHRLGTIVPSVFRARLGSISNPSHRTVSGNKKDMFALAECHAVRRSAVRNPGVQSVRLVELYLLSAAEINGRRHGLATDVCKGSRFPLFVFIRLRSRRILFRPCVLPGPIKNVSPGGVRVKKYTRTVYVRAYAHKWDPAPRGSRTRDEYVTRAFSRRFSNGRFVRRRRPKLYIVGCFLCFVSIPDTYAYNHQLKN